MKEILEQIDKELNSNFKEVFKSLQPGASEDQLQKLSNLFPNHELPDEITTLYKWHNGQVGYFSLNQNDNRTFAPVDEVIDTWVFLNDPMEDILEPISKSWVPILYNGAGDYIMYISEGANQGKLLSYWHDDEVRKIEYANFNEWALDALKSTKA